MDVAEAISQIANGKRFSELPNIVVDLRSDFDRGMVSGACVAAIPTATYMQMKTLRDFVAARYESQFATT